MITILLGFISVILGCVAGYLIPTISFVYSKYLAIAIMAAIDSIIGAFASKTQGKFNMLIFLSGFFVNAIIAILFTLIVESLNVDIYLAAIFVFVYRIFNNLSIIRRFFVEKATKNV